MPGREIMCTWAEDKTLNLGVCPAWESNPQPLCYLSHTGQGTSKDFRGKGFKESLAKTICWCWRIGEYFRKLWWWTIRIFALATPWNRTVMLMKIRTLPVVMLMKTVNWEGGTGSFHSQALCVCVCVCVCILPYKMMSSREEIPPFHTPDNSGKYLHK